MTDKPRPKRSAEHTRARILEAAIEAFAQRGFEGARVDAIAAAARSNKRMIYAYFGGKEGLYDAALEPVIQTALDTLRLRADPDLSPEERTRGMIRGYMHFLAEHPHFVRLLAWESLAATQSASVPASDLVGVGLERLAQLVERGDAEGVFHPPGDVHHLVVAVNSMCLGFFNRRAVLEQQWSVDFADPATVDALADTVEGLVLEGLLRRPSSVDAHPTEPR